MSDTRGRERSYFGWGYNVARTTDSVLVVSYSDGYYTHRNVFDFLSGVLKVSVSDQGVSAIPFSQVDPDLIEIHRKKLIELGGNPPEVKSGKIDKPFRVAAKPAPAP